LHFAGKKLCEQIVMNHTMILFSLAETGSSQPAPVVTIPAG
jgi:hypothetical protein